MALTRNSAQMALVVACCSAVAILAALIPVNFFICLLRQDYLNYFLMAQKIAATGHSTITYAINQPPIIYASGAGYVYAPIMALFHSFDFQFRAVQTLNLVFFGCYLWLAFQYFGEVLQARVAQIVSIIFAIITLADWRTLGLVMMPNADILPAVVTVASFLVMSSKRVNDWQKLLLIATLCVPVFFIKMSVIVLPITCSILVLARRDRNVRFIALGVPIIPILLFATYWATAQIYVHLAIHSYLFPQGHASVLGLLSVMATIVASLVFVALPESIIPNFHYIFLSNINYVSNGFAFGEVNARSMLGLAFGASISIAIIVGALRLWKTRPFDFLAFAIALPVFALIADGTSRYLVGYQPLLWCCFLETMIPLARRVRWTKLTGLLSVLALGAMFFLIQNQYLMMRSKKLGSLRDIAGVVRYFDDVSTAYGGVRGYLDGLPVARSLVIFMDKRQYVSPVWTAVSHLENYDVGNARKGWDSGKRVFLVVACRAPWCSEMSGWRDEIVTRLRSGCATFTPRVQWETAAASAEILEYKRASSCTRPIS